METRDESYEVPFFLPGDNLQMAVWWEEIQTGFSTFPELKKLKLVFKKVKAPRFVGQTTWQAGTVQKNKFQKLKVSESLGKYQSKHT